MFTHNALRYSPNRRLLSLALCGCVLFSATGEYVGADELPSRHLLSALGEPLSDEQLAALPQHVFADGEGLPAGEGTAIKGEHLYAQLCAACHGPAGQGGRAMELVGDRSLLASDYPDKGIAVYWPNAPTLFEYIYRSMPPQAPASLQADDLYSIIAYLLKINGLLDDVDMSVNADVLSRIDMPNRTGFVTIGH